MTNAISVDVEDYFHPTEVQAYVPMNLWDELPSRVVDSTRKVLDLFARHGVRGTFFILGWVADRFPALVREIAAAQHELGCHSFAHRLVYDMTPEEFRDDTLRAKTAIEQAAGISPLAYRAPSYSITERSLWALDILAECGFTHDSSIYPVDHDRYGIPGFPRHAHARPTKSGSIMEVPVAAVRMQFGCVAPVGGGGYFRLLPYRYTAAGIRRLNERERQPACIYFHPWELDNAQPRLAKSAVSKLRTYVGVGSMEGKLDRLLGEFSFSTLSAVYPAPTAVGAN
jgi:polysaccharide deacetylase family protein (PEP-CTERM system associated)